MISPTTTSAEVELVETLRELLDRCPFPSCWHPGWSAIAEVLEDFRAAVEALERPAELVTDCYKPGAEVAAARERLEALPRPAGQHPYLDVIVPTLEAMEAALDLLEREPRAAATFARRRRGRGVAA